MRMITILSGVVLVGTGIWAFVHPGASFLSIAFVLGVSMLLSGVSSIVTYSIYRKKTDPVILQLSTGVTTILLAGMLLSDLLIADGIVVLFFGMWILFTGTNRIVASLFMKDRKLHGWYLSLISGLVSVSLGILACTDILADGMTMVMIIGFTFLLEGTNMIIAGISLKSQKHNLPKGESNHECV